MTTAAERPIAAFVQSGSLPGLVDTAPPPSFVFQTSSCAMRVARRADLEIFFEEFEKLLVYSFENRVMRAQF
jgi:hypothetical protein